jgi:hypothetical protein
MAGLIVRDSAEPDAVTIDDTFGAVLAYRDGIYRWTPAQAQRFRAAGKLVFPCTVTGAEPDIAQVADCEAGNLSPYFAARWAAKRNALHGDATIYVSLDNLADQPNGPGLITELGDEPCWLWVAAWSASGNLVIPDLELPAHIKLAAVQYATAPSWDTSAIVSSTWPAHPYNLADW